ncbi:uncharacterized protein PV09_06887 [Verruconis gallopava]|uniref:HMG box domain-containing protein n=1 Tax=Verruconis gallopava TaxID=253628 RepID=A0A0D2A5A3_9PEZI|nr:uncharacterized protein PV09_06887 [Verruconis gallopava]KIW01710.1 hypothetical protein PV09_06887 [Verruconis gallopava]
MTDLGERLERLGLSEYVERLAMEGFDTWETVLDITESDLNTLGFKLGHRRKLQRAIAETRGQPAERALVLDQGKVAVPDDAYHSDESMADAKDSSGHITPAVQTNPSSAGTKRKYRRHPKADENAPERPPSAYVIFSNQVREELKGQELSFTEIAKLVGERWQVLDPAIREAFEKQAASAKEKYYAQMAEYKKTPQYQEYQRYLADFKAKHATPRTEGKRSKTHIDANHDTVAKSNSPEKRRSSLVDNVPSSQHRPRSNPTTAALGAYGSYQPPSASTSPAQASIGLQSPDTHHAYSPRSSPPASAPVYGTSYELPHHARGTQSAAELRLRDYPSGQTLRNWQQSPVSENSTTTSLGSEFLARRQPQTQTTIPSLVHQDTSHSSHGSDILPPPAPYQAHVLPPLDPSKADRILPQPLPSIMTPSLVSSPFEMRTQHQSPTALTPGKPPSLGQSSQFDALLRASELARDADLQDEAARRAEASN